jgi:hypothetical protein
MRDVLGPRRVEVTGNWRKLHNEELRDLYSSPNMIGEVGGALRGARRRGKVLTRFWLVSLGRPRRRRDDIKTYVTRDRDTWRAVENTAMNLRLL